jgi:hypothetical protein
MIPMPIRVLRQQGAGIAVALTIALPLWISGCGRSVEQSFDLAYLTYARPDHPYGTLVRTGFDGEGGWQESGTIQLGQDAVLLFPPPHPSERIPYLSIVGHGDDKNTAVWSSSPGGEAGTEYRIGLPKRVVLLVANNASATASVIVFVDAGHAELFTREYGRQVVGLTANARCSVAILEYERPESLQVLGSCRYARADWAGERQVNYISRGGHLLNYDLDATRFDTLWSDVAAFSRAARTGEMAISFEGDSIVVFDRAGRRKSETFTAASVPRISSDGAYLAYHKSDHGFWICDLADRTSTEIGVGYGQNWSGDSRLVLFFERQQDERRVVHTIFHVADAATGAVVTLPEDGFVVDAVLLP